MAQDTWDNHEGSHDEKYKAAREAFREALKDATHEEVTDMVFVFTVGERPPEDRVAATRN